MSDDKKQQQEIERLIGNRFYEHGHPFEGGHAGMEDFAKLVPLLGQCDVTALQKHLSGIERIFSEVKDCESCTAKLCVFLSVFCEQAFPEKSAEYLQRAKKIQSASRYQRDYKREVYQLFGGEHAKDQAK